VWVNYLSNAVKYGGLPPRVEVGWSAEDAAGETEAASYRFWVRDNGSGLAPEEQARLYSPYVQLCPTGVEGHGLGLSIVRRIVEKLGGDVGVESVVGVGSTFWFTLPAADPGQGSEPEKDLVGMRSSMPADTDR
jgi:two-component system, sensor histidine kinase and response regulator